MADTRKDPKRDSKHHFLDLSPEQALFGPIPSATGASEPLAALDGMVATFHMNERPLHGLAGLLDWHFQGAISGYLRAGALQGEPGECAYLPMTRLGRTFHLLLIGAGSSSAPGSRAPLDTGAAAVLRKNIQSLKISRLGISRADLGNASREFFNQQMKDIPLWIVL